MSTEDAAFTCPFNFKKCTITCPYWVDNGCVASIQWLQTELPYEEGDTVLTMEKLKKAREALENYGEAMPNYIVLAARAIGKTLASHVAEQVINDYIKPKGMREEIIYADD